MSKREIIIATRESPLALCQAEWVKTALQKRHPDLSLKLLGITTEADQRLEVSLRKIGGKGLFVKALEDALLEGRADIAVHSMKDVPMELPAGLMLPVICKREEPRDVFVSNQYQTIMALPKEAIIGTSSLRRQTQLKAIRADLKWQDLRGNINTRLKKLDEGQYDGLILAAAGLHRMGFQHRIQSYLDVETCLPAAGQGALGIECRDDDAEVMKFIAPLFHEKTALCVIAERALCQKLNGGCQIPIGAYAEIHGDRLTLRGLVANREGTRILRATCAEMKGKPETTGSRVADLLYEQGAAEILRAFYE